jgi:uncharacterized protein YndB with AHSA1/START domain
MPEFTITRQIDAPVEKVWELLDDFGAISRWNDGVKRSALTSEGPVAEGSTRRCDFAPFGGVDERIDTYVPNERMRIDLYETDKLPIDRAVADFRLAPNGDGTELALHYEYTLNRLGRLAKGQTDKQMRKGMTGMADALAEESHRITVG